MSSEDNKEQDQTLYILNQENKYITKEFIENLLKKYGNIEYKVNNLECFQEAMTHISYLKRSLTLQKSKQNKIRNKPQLEPIEDPNSAIPLRDVSYERLEYLGDAVIHLILAKYLYIRYEAQNEGFMTKLRTKIENSDTLANLCSIIKLNEYILLSRYIEINGGRNNKQNILEDSFEAFMGALLLDSNFDICSTFMINLLEKEVDFAQLLHTETNFKDKLLQYFHKMKYEDPTYGQYDVCGSDHKRFFTMYVKRRKNPRDDGEIVGIGVGTSKKRGEQEAAKAALVKFNVIKDENADSGSMEEYLSSIEEEDY